MRLGALALGLAALATAGAPAQAQETVTWMTDLSEARAKAKEEGRPLLVVFR